MKRTMTFRFTETTCSVDSMSGYYFCELGYDQETMEEEEGEGSGNLAYLMTRNYQGDWKMVGCGSELPDWVFEYELKFGEAIDESLGISALHLPVKSR